MDSTAIVLAAGQGTRMKSKLPKVLHKVAGIPMLGHVLNTLERADVKRKIVVLGHGAELIEKWLPEGIEVVYQWEQLGTGHAVLQAEKLLQGVTGNVMVVCGDTPLLQKLTLENLQQRHIDTQAQVTILTAVISDPQGYGRIIRENNQIQAIIEEKDAKDQEKAIREINTGTYCFSADFLINSLAKLTNTNAQGEYYLTDLIKLAVKEGLKVEAFVLDDIKESLGINNRIQLAEAEKVLQLRALEKLMLAGVTIIDPSSTYIGCAVEVGADSIIYPGTILEGKTVIGQDCLIGPGVRIGESAIGNNCQIQNAVILESKVGNNCSIGPFAYLRPGTILEDNVKIGDFVEIKKSVIGRGSKVPHLSYIGDAFLGEKVNIGCGTITCNYDGKNKYITRIEDDAFIGSNTNLIAPVTVGKNAVIGAGSTINKDVPANALGIAREIQKNIPDWAKSTKDN
ncbi:MAG: bifunctional N-acetylglucosamine-1-phosphate uridyltransferase/glucosamine-1-phosphate acetyltransferase [Peptococcaceae bacterium BICA1-8]|nr:MAG: bifunctional N-acetylglucosamine-1-phosphate uridyltransferase/glucosamine-1-phosphate acetyltransferase [Peptococcaceae bacterium BICA1-8]